MKTTIKLLSVLIIGMGVAGTSFANPPFSSGENFGGTVFDPIGSRQCHYEIYCNRTTGEVGIDPEHIIIEDFGSVIAPGAWSGYRFGTKD